MKLRKFVRDSKLNLKGSYINYSELKVCYVIYTNAIAVKSQFKVLGG
jgi:hypothetical protein